MRMKLTVERAAIDSAIPGIGQKELNTEQQVQRGRQRPGLASFIDRRDEEWRSVVWLLAQGVGLA